MRAFGWLLLLMLVPEGFAGQYRVERVPVAGGAELLSVYGGSGQQIPLVSVLRDTLGDTDPDNDRLRYVWSLTGARPGVRQRVLAAMPFLYLRFAPPRKPSQNPAPLVDLTAPRRPVWRSLMASTVQVLFVDEMGPAVRSSSRKYRDDTSLHRQTNVMQALAVLAEAETELVDGGYLSEAQMQQIKARLSLASRTLGGFVSETNLSRVDEKEDTEADERRGHNWELLRQRAEEEGLIFDPLTPPSGSPQFAMLWISQRDLHTLETRGFDGHLLGISNPWRDSRLQHWQGYIEQRGEDRWIPLALYGLDYPRTPLLLVDFRDGGRARRREVAQRAMDDMTRGVLGLSRFANWYYFAGQAAWDFFRGRHGAALDRSSRLRAYAALKSSLTFDQSLPLPLRQEVERRLDRVSTNQLESRVEQERSLAQAQHQALLRAAENSHRLPARIARDRREEAAMRHHGPKTQAWFGAWNLLSLGMYTHREPASSTLPLQLGQERRLETHKRYLAEVIAGSPQTEVVYDMSAVRRSVRVLAQDSGDPEVPRLVAALFLRTADEETRAECVQVLQHLRAREQLQALSAHAGIEARWRDRLRQEPAASDGE